MKPKDIKAGMQIVLPKFKKIKNCLFAVSRIESKRVRLVNFVHFHYITTSEFVMFAKDGRVYSEEFDGQWNGKEKFDNGELSELR
jgi:hypothetical protein